VCHEGIWGREVIIPIILHFGTKCSELSASFLSPLTPGKEPQPPLHSPQPQSGYLEEKICSPQWECNNSFTNILSVAWSVYWPSSSRTFNQ